MVSIQFIAAWFSHYYAIKANSFWLFYLKKLNIALPK